jgi:hypothetical protein
MVKTIRYEPIDSIRFNVKFKSGGLLTRLVADEVCGLRPAEIEWVYLVEQRRNATPEEIKALCRRAPKRTSGTV